MRFPLNGRENTDWKITTYFSPQHLGIDIAPLPAGKQGVLCFAPENATVVNAGYVATLEGNFVILKGDSGMFYYFGHFANQMMMIGKRVTEGQQIGVLGMTGLATGIHTHHEVRKIAGPGQSIDPVEYYKNNQGGNMPTIVDENIAAHLLAGFFLWPDPKQDGGDAMKSIINQPLDAKMLGNLLRAPQHTAVVDKYNQASSGQDQTELKAKAEELDKALDKFLGN